MISLETLEQPFTFDNDNSLESLDEDIQLNNYNNILNYRKFIIAMYKKKYNLSNKSKSEVAVATNNKKEKKVPAFFSQIAPFEYSLYLTTDKFIELMFIQPTKQKIMSEFIAFRNIIYNTYEKTKEIITLHFIPCLSIDEMFTEIGLIEGIFAMLKDNRIKIIGYLNKSASLIDTYLVSAYADDIVIYPITSSIYIDIRKRFGKAVLYSMNNMYAIKLQIIGDRNLLTESEIKDIVDNEKSITSVSNAELIKRIKVK